MTFKNIEAIFNSAKKNVSARDISTFGVGGFLEHVLYISNADKALSAIEILNKTHTPYIVISGGSNIVFPDGVLEKLVIVLRNDTITIKKNKITCDAGTPLEKLIETSIDLGYQGLESLSGIPGSVGGALVGNAGAYGSSISNFVENIFILNEGLPRMLLKEECSFTYRESVFKKRPFIILSAVFVFEKKEDSKKLKEKSNEIIFLRSKKYKKGLRCPGSFFKNVLVEELEEYQLKKIDKSKIIEGKVPSGYLLERVGACGMRIGGIEVASFHGNLLINKKNGTAHHVEKLSNLLKERVHATFGIELQEEVRYIKAL